MKMILVLLLITLHVQANLLGQSVNLTKKKVSLREVLKEIRKQSGVNILMDATTIDLAKPIPVQLHDVTVEEALQQVLTPQGLTYQRMDKNIIVSVSERGLEKADGPPTQARFVQAGQVQGTVRDNKGNPLPGASVLIKGTNLGVQTDGNGNYKIPVEKEEVLIVSLMGYATIEVPTKGRQRIDVVLTEESKQMEEVVVTGYSAIEKRHVASSVVSMDMDRATNRPVFKMQEAFSGTLPGVTVMQGGNKPGSVPGAIAIRGVGTLQGAEPLVIVDGMQQSLTDLDPNQIKSIQVLKDAASASLYGSRGANGVIIIETKRGSTGQFKVDLHTWSAFNEPIKLPNWV